MSDDRRVSFEDEDTIYRIYSENLPISKKKLERVAVAKCPYDPSEIKIGIDTCQTAQGAQLSTGKMIWPPYNSVKKFVRMAKNRIKNLRDADTCGYLKATVGYLADRGIDEVIIPATTAKASYVEECPICRRRYRFRIEYEAKVTMPGLLSDPLQIYRKLGFDSSKEASKIVLPRAAKSLGFATVDNMLSYLKALEEELTRVDANLSKLKEVVDALEGELPHVDLAFMDLRSITKIVVHGERPREELEFRMRAVLYEISKQLDDPTAPVLGPDPLVYGPAWLRDKSTFSGRLE